MIETRERGGVEMGDMSFLGGGGRERGEKEFWGGVVFLERWKVYERRVGWVDLRHGDCFLFSFIFFNKNTLAISSLIPFRAPYVYYDMT